MELKLCDCLDYMKTLPDNSVDLIVTDPPYDISVNHSGGRLYAVKKLEKSQDDLVDANLDESYDIEVYNTEFVRIMKDINIYIWCSKKQIPEYFNFYVNKRNCLFDILTWHKTNPLPTYSNKYLNDTEYLLYFKSGKGHCYPQSYQDAFSYYISPLNSEDKQKYTHPTVKPLDFIERLVRNSSKENEVVFDPFMGSGTTGVACKRLNRQFIGCEINPTYFDIAQQRMGLASSVLVEKCGKKTPHKLF